MKFKFSLDSVLKVRKHKEKMQKQKLAEKLLEKQELDENRNMQKEQLKEFLSETESQDTTTLREIKSNTSHIETVNHKVFELSKKLDKANEKVKNQRSKLAEAHKQLHIMEKVRDFEHTLFNDREFKREQKFMDEIATQSYGK